MGENRLVLSSDINVITAEINSYKQIAGQSIFEIGRRLKHVKENDLAHGDWEKWCKESLNMSPQQAWKYTRVYERFSNLNSSLDLGVAALNELVDFTDDQINQPHVIPSTGETKTVDEMTVKELQEVKATLRVKEEDLRKINILKLELQEKIDSGIDEKKKIEVELSNLKKEKNKTEYISTTVEIDKPSTIARLEKLEKDLKEKEEYVTKYQDSLNQLNEKNEIINKFMGENTNFQLIANTSEITLKMMNFTKEMSKYDYLSDAFNEIPDATRKEYVRSVYGVYKWARSILQEVRHDDVIGINKDIIDIKTNYTEVL